MYSLVTLSLPSRYSLELPSYIYTFSIFCLPHMHFQSHSHTLAFYYHSHTLSSTITTTLSIYPFHLPLLTPFPSTPSTITHTLSIYQPPFYQPGAIRSCRESLPRRQRHCLSLGLFRHVGNENSMKWWLVVVVDVLPAMFSTLWGVSEKGSDIRAILILGRRSSWIMVD